MFTLKNYFIIGGLVTTFLLACASDKNPLIPNTPIEALTGDVKIFTTTNNLTFDFKKSFVNHSTTSNMSPRTVTLDETIQYQTMDGFGTAITGSTCYNLLKMSAENRHKFLVETFSETEGMGQSYIRIAIGCSDFSLSEYTLNDTPGIANFSLQNEEKQYILPILKEILAINPKVKILGSPWTAPKWMKVNNLNDRQAYDSWTGGHLNPSFYQDYATYFVKWVQALKNEGIAVYAVTPQNEPLNAGNSASMLMHWQEQQAFVRDALGPKLKAAGLGTKIYAFDHNFNYDNISDQEDYPVKIFQDAEASAYFAGSAYHNYGGDKSELLDIHTKAPNKDIIFTETSIGTWNDGQNLGVRLMEDMREVGLGTINNWSKAVIVWNLLLDTERGPYREGGCKTCYGAVDLNSKDYATMRKNSHYYVVGHLSSVVKPGATRIGTRGFTQEGITYSAFKNVDGSFAVVLLNETNDASRITFSDGVNHFSYETPAKSVVSYTWKK